MRGIFALACPWLCRCATSKPKPTTKRTLRRVITDHLFVERRCVIVRLEYGMSASSGRLHLAVQRPSSLSRGGLIIDGRSSTLSGHSAVRKPDVNLWRMRSMSSTQEWNQGRHVATVGGVLFTEGSDEHLVLDMDAIGVRQKRG